MLSLTLSRAAGGWVVSDEGHTFMRLSDDLDMKDLERGSRARIVRDALASFGVAEDDGTLSREAITDAGVGEAVYGLIQAAMRIYDVRLVSRERVKSTFLEDVRATVMESVPPDRVIREWHDVEKDPDSHYPADYRIEQDGKPVFLFALGSDDKVKDATITLHQYERWGWTFHSVGIFENQEEINRKTLARFSDIADKQFSTLAGNQERIRKHLAIAS